MKKIIVFSLFLLILLSGCNKIDNENRLNKNINNEGENINNNTQTENEKLTNNTPNNGTKNNMYSFEKFDKDIKVIIKTNKGDIKLDVYGTKAPITVGNFVYLINQGFYKDIKFHRVISDFMIQTGDPNSKGVVGEDFVYDPYNNPDSLPIAGTGGPGYKFEDEVKNGLLFDKSGVLAMANSGPNTNGSQFFITHVKTDWLNGKHTIFGQVVSGQDVVDSIVQGDYIEDIIIEK